MAHPLPARSQAQPLRLAIRGSGVRAEVSSLGFNAGALIIRIGLGGILDHSYNNNNN